MVLLDGRKDGEKGFRAHIIRADAPGTGAGAWKRPGSARASPASAFPRVHNGAMVTAVPWSSRSRLAGLAALAAALAMPAGAEIFRCTSPRGDVSYQQAACPAMSASRVVDVPSSYPNADPMQRQQLFEREAALDRRLEARRERETREAIARDAQAAAEAAAQSQQQADTQPLWLPSAPFPTQRYVRALHGPRMRGANRS